MCGILGIIDSVANVPEIDLRHGLYLLAHRGPDGEGVWHRPAGAAPFVALGHRRLAIIDLSEAAAQPMSNREGTCWITYNGEIYNYVELRAELAHCGYRFRSTSDTEVVLAAYEAWGPECVNRLNGMFAVAIWDERRRELFAARDRFGEKPFHYIWDPQRGRFAFASEIKALLALPFVDASLDERALYRYVVFQELAGSDETLWRGVKRLPHAHWLRLTWRDGRLDVICRRYWDINLEATANLTLDNAAVRLAELFADSVRLRLRSDVPVGTSLSGGIDSSAVVCQIHALGAAGGQASFSARMEDPALDEGVHIGAVTAKTGVANHQVWPSSAELARAFPRLCYHQEEPFPATSQFAQFLVMRLARESGVSVLLDGQGADELFAGYTPYFVARYADLCADWHFAALGREWHRFRTRHGRAFPIGARALAARLFPSTYRWITRHRPDIGRLGFGSSAISSWWNGDWLRAFAGEIPPPPPPTVRDGLTRKLYADALGGPLQELLRYGDRNSMAWSRELRQPFLDHRIAELVFGLPSDHKISGGQTKVVLRAAMRRLVPGTILERQDKLGYQAPLAAWMRGSLAAWTEERLEQASCDLNGHLVARPVDRFRAIRSSLDEGSARPVFALLALAEARRQLEPARLRDQPKIRGTA